ncbi:MAG: GNAT family N-acetyltransferase [Betaproteobacteria bacterium]
MGESPVPEDLAESWQVIHGYSISARPLRPSDLDIESAFVEGLSRESRYNRLLGGAINISRAYIEQLTTIDYSRDMALAAVVMIGETEVLIGVARYVQEQSPDGGPGACEFAIVVADAWQGRGIGRHLMQKLIGIAGRRGLPAMFGEILATNHGMLMMMRSLGFRIARHPEDGTVVRATLDLQASREAAAEATHSPSTPDPAA